MNVDINLLTIGSADATAAANDDGDNDSDTAANELADEYDSEEELYIPALLH